MTLIRRMNMDFFFASQKEGFYSFAVCRVTEIIQIIPSRFKRDGIKIRVIRVPNQHEF